MWVPGVAENLRDLFPYKTEPQASVKNHLSDSLSHDWENVPGLPSLNPAQQGPQAGGLPAFHSCGRAFRKGQSG